MTRCGGRQDNCGSISVKRQVGEGLCLKGHSALKKAEVPEPGPRCVCVEGERDIRQEGSSVILSLNGSCLHHSPRELQIFTFGAKI